MRTLALVLGLGLLAACGREEAAAPRDGTVAARVGDAVLTEGELADALQLSVPGLDSLSARRQIVEQWVQRQLVVQEARAQGLDADPDVQRQLRDSESAVLQAAFLDRYFETDAALPTDAEIQGYYESNLDRLTLPEPYVRVQLIRTQTADAAAQAADALAQISGSPHADSLFALAAREYGMDPEGAIDLADSYLPVSRFRALDDRLGQLISDTGAGARPSALTSGQAHFAVAITDRIPTGQTPSVDALRAELSQRIAIRKRRDAEAQLIQRLRATAQARGQLEVR